MKMKLYFMGNADLITSYKFNDEFFDKEIYMIRRYDPLESFDSKWDYISNLNSRCSAACGMFDDVNFYCFDEAKLISDMNLLNYHKPYDCVNSTFVYLNQNQDVIYKSKNSYYIRRYNQTEQNECPWYYVNNQNQSFKLSFLNDDFKFKSLNDAQLVSILNKYP